MTTLAYFGAEWGYLCLLTVFGIPILLVVIFWTMERIGFLPQRHAAGACRNCGYNLTGNVSGRCPECGRSIDAG